MHVFRNFRHVPAIRRLMKYHVDPVERSSDRSAVANIAFNEFGFRIDPAGLSEPVCIRLEVVQDSNLPTLANQEIGQMRSDQAGSAGNERASSVRVAGHGDYNRFLAVSSTKNFRVSGATSASAWSDNNSPHKR